MTREQTERAEIGDRAVSAMEAENSVDACETVVSRAIRAARWAGREVAAR